MITISDRDKVKLGENIRRIRKEKGLSQKQFSEMTGISVGRLSKYEHGNAVPDHESLMRMSVVLGESVNMIMMNFEDPDRKKTLKPLIKD